VTVRGGDHRPVIEVSGPETPEVPVGATFDLKIGLSCPDGCDLSALPVEVTGPDGAIAVLIKDGATADLGNLTLNAPPTVGEHVWRLSVSPVEAAGVAHAGCTCSVAIRTRPHETSLAVWAIPSPVVTGQSFVIKAGAKSTADCELAGCRIEVLDDTGTTIATGDLGSAPWPGTAALYWTELQVSAPHKAGMFSWSVRFDPAGLALPHEGATSHFSIAIVDPPEHRLTVKVIERDTAAPVADAQVRLGAYRCSTDPSGTAEIMLPKGAYDLNVWRAGYEAPTSAVTIAADVTVEVQVAAIPGDDPDSVWQM